MSGSGGGKKKKGVKRSSAGVVASKTPARVIDEIMCKRFDSNNRPLVLVRWKDSEQWTWESPEELDVSALTKISDYEAKLQFKKMDRKRLKIERKKKRPADLSSSSDSSDSSYDSSDEELRRMDFPRGTRPQPEAVIPAAVPIKSSGKNAAMYASLNIADSDSDASDSSSRSITSSSSASSSGSSKRNKSITSVHSSPKKTGFDDEPPLPWNHFLEESYPTGLDEDFKLEKIVTAHKIAFETFFVVKWKAQKKCDLVMVKDMIALYSGDILSYFADLPRTQMKD